MLIIRTLLILGVLVASVFFPLTAQERGRGGRTPAPSSSQQVRGPEGTRERPVFIPAATVPTPQAVPPVTHPAPSYNPCPSPVYVSVSMVEVTPTYYDGRAPEPPPALVVFSGGREGFSVVLGDFEDLPEYAGFDFSEEKYLPYDDPACDMFFEDAGSAAYMVVGEDAEIQNMGSTGSLGTINALRMVEWSRSHDVILEEGHSYVVKTWDGRHAMFRVVSLVPNRVVFDWVYQRQGMNTAIQTPGHLRPMWVTRAKYSR